MTLDSENIRANLNTLNIVNLNTKGWLAETETLP